MIIFPLFGISQNIPSSASQLQGIVGSVERAATQHLLETRPEEDKFNVQLIESDVDWSSRVRIHSFSVNYSLNKKDNNSDREVLLMITNPGYMTELGVDFALVNFKFLSREEWNRIIYRYFEAAVGFNVVENDVVYVYEKIKEKNIDDYEHVESILNEKGKLEYFTKSNRYFTISNVNIGDRNLHFGAGENFVEIVPFQKLDENSFIRLTYNNEMDIVYNEKSLGFYLKDTKRLVQIDKKVVNEIHKFLNKVSQ